MGRLSGRRPKRPTRYYACSRGTKLLGLSLVMLGLLQALCFGALLVCAMPTIPVPGLVASMMPQAAAGLMHQVASDAGAVTTAGAILHG